MTPEQNAQRARLAALTRWAGEDPKPQLARMRAKFEDRFEKEVDPDGTLEPEERKRRAVAARKAYYVRLGLASSRARSKKK